MSRDFAYAHDSTPGLGTVLADAAIDPRGLYRHLAVRRIEDRIFAFHRTFHQRVAWQFCRPATQNRARRSGFLSRCLGRFVFTFQSVLPRRPVRAASGSKARTADLE